VNLLSAQPKSAPPQISSRKSEKKVIYAHFAARDEISKSCREQQLVVGVGGGRWHATLDDKKSPKHMARVE
jgi:hypothetical protein